MKTLLCRTMYAAVLVATCVALSAVFAVAEAPSAEFVAAALRQQETAAGPSLDVDYTFGIPDTAAAKAGTGRIFMHYVRTPGVRFMEERAEVYSAAATWDPVFTARTSYNRTNREYRKLTIYAKESEKSQGVIGEGDAPGPFGKVEYMETANYWMMVTPLADGLARGAVCNVPEDVDGHACWKVSVSGESIGMKSENRIYVWVDQSIAMCPRRIDSLHQGQSGVQIARVDFLDYEQVAAGVWFPKRMYISVDGPAGPVVSCCNVKSVSAGGAVPEAATSVEFPTGTTVRILAQDAIYTVP